MNQQDANYMQLALACAAKAFDRGEVPIGSLVVSSQGLILGKGYNQTERKHCQSRHAEVIAIESATKKMGDWRLNGCTLYVTVEPCLMCMSLIALSRIERVVYGASSPLFGYNLDKELLPELYKKQIKGISKGVLASEAEGLLKRFFNIRRKQSE